MKTKQMKEHIFLLVKCTIKTKHKSIHEAIAELQSKTRLFVGHTKNVEVLKTEIMRLKTRTTKTKYHGTPNQL